MAKKIFFILTLVACSFPVRALGYMTSTDYTIYADSISAGDVFSSGTYRLENTAGETPAGFTTSSNYVIRGGYQAMDYTSISMSIDNTSLSLGSLDSSHVNTASAIVTINSTAGEGYVLAISSVTGTIGATFTSVSAGGAVTAGQTVYGFSISGADNALGGGDWPVTAGTIASTNTAVTNDQTTLTLKASIANSALGATAVSASQTIGLTASANL